MPPLGPLLGHISFHIRKGRKASSDGLFNQPLRRARVLVWILVKLRLAALTAEIVGLPLMLGLPCGILLVNLHAAHRVRLSCHNFLPPCINPRCVTEGDSEFGKLISI